MRDQLQKWLQIAKIWYDTRASLKSYLPEHNELSELEEFLHKLSEALGSALCVRHAIENFPETGQFLGRLSALPCLLAISNIYKYYVRCLLALYTETPKGEIETKASSWAMSQIRYSFKSDGSSLREIRAAAENRCIFIAIDYWLKGMCIKSGMNYKWVFIALWYLEATSRHPTQPNVVSIQPPIFMISGCSLSCIKAQVKSISQLIRTDASIYSLHPAFFAVFHHAALFLSLISTNESRRSCVHLLLFRYSDIEFKYVERMQEFVAGLGCLMLKSHVEKTAVECCWGPMTATDASDEAGVMCRLIARQLLLALLLLTPLRTDVSEFILEKATESVKASDWLESLVDTVMIALSLNVPWIQLPSQHLLCLLSSLWDRAQHELPCVTCITDAYEERPVFVDDRFKLLDFSLRNVRKLINQNPHSC
ncbi:hypothetical protein CAPTEDRAFT_228171 [Capitella teleta]|uniref:Uncharacterized protein n=1 Tax=Capitella teleta TaxID=283909 RepID=R7UAE3_CAPTE|nr:hypothetical protein CAPTEDRAFT_228171 [Capitella teleta]|eukprot:ELU03335.1 hypothetical protein CAPTEDRAFT_228171 [Capitella teleta]